MATYIQFPIFSKVTVTILFICNLYTSIVFSNPLPQFSFPVDTSNDGNTTTQTDLFSNPFPQLLFEPIKDVAFPVESNDVKPTTQRSQEPTQDTNFPVKSNNVKSTTEASDEILIPRILDFNDVKNCIDDDYSMPFVNSTGEVECHTLLTQGPCESDEWFVLSHAGSDTNSDLPQAICKARECNPIPHPETTALQETVMFNGKCTPVTSSEECEGNNMVVLINPLGEGECNCKDKFIEWHPNGDSECKKCYQEYLQGPCQSGYQLVPKQDVELFVNVNNRPLNIPVFFGISPTQIAIKDEDTDLSGSICIPSDCEEEGFIRLKTGECVEPKSCQKDETLGLSTEFSNNMFSTEIKFHQDISEFATCCFSDYELAYRKKIISQHNGTTIAELLKENACADLDVGLVGRSALVTIPESCPTGQTITHDGECKHVRIWRSRPRRNTNSNTRIRQMMRYVRALRRRFFSTCE